MNKRLISSFFMCAIVLALFFLKATGILILSSLITTLILYEILRLDQKSKIYTSPVLLLYSGSILSLLTSKLPYINYFLNNLVPIIFIFILLELLRKKTLIRNLFFNHSKMFLALLICSYSIMSLYLLDMKLFLVLIIYISLTDTLSYFFGKKFGKTKLSPISPNKTIEGFIYSYFILSIGILIMLKINTFDFKTCLYLFFIPPLALLGDLHESLFKREKKVKNSSELIPGHGGFYDRFDSYIIALPCYYFFIS